MIFKSKKKIPYPEEYNEYSEKLHALVKEQEGFLKFENWVNEEGYSVSLSYWDKLESLKAWKQAPLHKEAKSKAKWNWYEEYSVEVCEIKQSYSGSAT